MFYVAVFTTTIAVALGVSSIVDFIRDYYGTRRD